jgi:Glycosyltransferase family 87
MLSQIRIDRRVLYGFLLIATAMNAGVFLLSWRAIMAGKNDFPPFYASAQMVREGQASRLYDFEAENIFVHRVSPVTRPPNNHLPYEIVIFVPFTYLQFGTAYVLWILLNVGLLAGIVMLMSDVGPRRGSLSPNLLAVLAFFPLWYCLLQGQDSILLAFLFALSFWFWRRDQDYVAGFLLALGLFRPQLVLPFVLVAFLAWKRKFVCGFVPGAILVLLVSTEIVGPRGMVEYGRILLSQGTQSSANALLEQWRVHLGLMPTLRGFLCALFFWVPRDIQNFLLLSGTFGTLLWAASRMRGAKSGGTFDVAFATGVAGITLVSFHSLIHDFSLMILPLLIVARVVAPSIRSTGTIAYTTVTTAFLFFFTPLYIVLLFTDKVGLFVLPTVAFLWLVNRWETDGLPDLAAEHDFAEPISLRTV